MVEYPEEWTSGADARFAQRLKAERDRSRISQTQVVAALAERHGIRWHQSTVTKVEAGERPVRLAEALALADVLGVSLYDLLEDPDSPAARQRRSERLRGRRDELFHMQVQLSMRMREVGDELDDLDGGGELDTGDDAAEAVADGEHREAP